MDDFSFIKSQAYQNFLASNSNADCLKLRLKALRNEEFDIDFAIRQIECRQKVAKKLPSLHDKILYPTNLSIEQCTTEPIAAFHASLFRGCKNAIDFTCGLGIDSFFISHSVERLISIELDTTIANVARFNFKKLEANNIHVENADSENFAGKVPFNEFVGFIDPARRDKSDKQQRIFRIADCTPDINIIIPKIQGKCQFMIVKASPMVDITQTIRDFPGISDIWIVSLRNECKELLFKIDFSANKQQQASIHTINFEQDRTEIYNVTAIDNRIDYKTPEIGENLLVPNSSIMKSGEFGKLGKEYNLSKIAQNSNIFIGSECSANEGFPGRIFKIKGIYSMSKSDIKKLKSSIDSANISCRNFHLSPDELRKRIKIKDGGDNYIFATTTAANKQIIIHCRKY